MTRIYVAGHRGMVGSAIALLGVVATLVLVRRRDSQAHVALGGAAAESPSAG